jgi:hypothetical protein
MDLEEIKIRESGIRALRVRQLSARETAPKEIDFKIAEGRIQLGEKKLAAWVVFFIITSLTAFFLCYIAFGDSNASICNADIPLGLENLCVGWQLLFMLVFSILILPISFLVGTIEFFRDIKEKTEISDKISEQLYFQENLKMISKVLIYSLFILAVQIMIYFKSFDFLPDILKLPFLVFDTDAMLPIALALLYYAVQKRDVFFLTSRRLLYIIIFLNLVSIMLSRGVQLVWDTSLGKLF